MTITGDQALMREINRMALVRAIQRIPGQSRAELAKETGLTKSTVSLLVQDLIDAGASDPGREDYVMARLSDTGALLDAMSKLRTVYPNALAIERVENRFETGRRCACVPEGR